MKRFGGNLSAGAQGHSLFRGGVKDAVDLHDIIVEQAPDLDHRAGWIGRLTPELCLRLVDHGRVAMQVADVYGDPHAILQACALRPGNQPDIEECLYPRSGARKRVRGPASAGIKV